MTAIERHTAALAAELRKWKARAEKAEQERDEALAQIDAHLTLCNGAPMTTVDEDGRAWRATSFVKQPAGHALAVFVLIKDAL